MEEYRSPRVWWTALNRGPFDPLFESRNEAVIHYGILTALMRVFEQPNTCEV